MARRKNAEQVVAPPIATTPNHPGWNPPKAPMNGAVVQPPPAEIPPTPVYKIEHVAGAKRPMVRVSGYDISVANYVSRHRQAESEAMALEEGKTWFRNTARQIRAETKAETVVFVSSTGAIEVVFTAAKRVLDQGLVADAEQSPALQNLLQSNEILTGKHWTWLLDNTFVKAPDGQTWLSLRAAVAAGLGFEVKKETKLIDDYAETAARIAPTLSDRDKEILEKLEAAGLNAPTMRVSK